MPRLVILSVARREAPSKDEGQATLTLYVEQTHDQKNDFGERAKRNRGKTQDQPGRERDDCEDCQ